jgi:hypothetical protein
MFIKILRKKFVNTKTIKIKRKYYNTVLNERIVKPLKVDTIINYCFFFSRNLQCITLLVNAKFLESNLLKICWNAKDIISLCIKKYSTTKIITLMTFCFA